MVWDAVSIGSVSGVRRQRSSIHLMSELPRHVSSGTPRRLTLLPSLHPIPNPQPPPVRALTVHVCVCPVPARRLVVRALDGAGGAGERAQALACVRQWAGRLGAARALPHEVAVALVALAGVEGVGSGEHGQAAACRYEALELLRWLAVADGAALAQAGGVTPLLNAAADAPTHAARAACAAAAAAALTTPRARQLAGGAGALEELLEALGEAAIAAPGDEEEGEGEGEAEAARAAETWLLRRVEALVLLARSWPGLLLLMGRDSPAASSALATAVAALAQTRSRGARRAALALLFGLLWLPMPPPLVPYGDREQSRTVRRGARGSAHDADWAKRRPPVRAPRDPHRAPYMAALLAVLAREGLPEALLGLADSGRAATHVPRHAAYGLDGAKRDLKKSVPPRDTVAAECAAVLLAELSTLAQALLHPCLAGPLFELDRLVERSVAAGEATGAHGGRMVCAARVADSIRRQALLAGDVGSGVSNSDTAVSISAGGFGTDPSGYALTGSSDGHASGGIGDGGGGMPGGGTRRRRATSAANRVTLSADSATAAALDAALALGHGGDNALSSAEERALEILLRSTAVTDARSANWQAWNWAALGELVCGPLRRRAVVARCLRNKVLKRILSFYWKRFPTLPRGSVAACTAAALLPKLIDSLLASEEGSNFLGGGGEGNAECLLLQTIAKGVRAETTASAASATGGNDDIFSTEGLSLRTGGDLLNVIFIMVRSSRGRALLGKFSIVQALAKAVERPRGALQEAQSQQSNTKLSALELALLEDEEDERTASADDGGGGGGSNCELAMAAVRLAELSGASAALRCVVEAGLASSSQVVRLAAVERAFSVALTLAPPGGDAGVQPGIVWTNAFTTEQPGKANEDEEAAAETAAWAAGLLVGAANELRSGTQEDLEVAAAAESVLAAAVLHCESVASLLVERWPHAKAAFDSPLAIALLSTPAGAEAMCGSGSGGGDDGSWAARAVAQWVSDDGVESYVSGIDTSLMRAFAPPPPQRRVGPSRARNAAADARERLVAWAENQSTPHIFGALAATACGRALLLRGKHLEVAAVVAEDPEAQNEKRKAALWALAHSAGAGNAGAEAIMSATGGGKASPVGANARERLGALSALLALAEGSANLALRGTALTALSVAARSPAVRALLAAEEVGWVCHGPLSGAGATKSAEASSAAPWAVALPLDVNLRLTRLASAKLMAVVHRFLESRKLRKMSAKARALKKRGSMRLATSDAVAKDPALREIARMCNSVVAQKALGALQQLAAEDPDAMVTNGVPDATYEMLAVYRFSAEMRTALQTLVPWQPPKEWLSAGAK